MNRAFISIIVLNFSGRAFLDSCLNSLLAQDHESFEILLVDNASTDGSAEYVAQKFPTVRVIANETNLGFAAGNNIGIRAARGEFIFIVNNDTETAPHALRALVQPMLDDARVGSTAPKLLRFDRRDLIDATGIAIDRAGIAWHLRHGQRDDGETNSRLVFGGSGAAVMYRKIALDEIGLFDEDYFAYYEDVDLAWRARNAGWKCFYVPSAIVYHIHSGTFKSYRRVAAQRLYLLGRNKWWTILKNYPMPQLLLFLPWILAVDFTSVLYSFVVRRELHSVSGRYAALRKWSKMYAKRVTIENTNAITQILQMTGEADFANALSTFLTKKIRRVGFDKLTYEEKVVYMIDWLEREVNNGGFHQYFFNSAGDHAQDVVDALRLIGAFHTADIVLRALIVFPDGFAPRDRIERQNQLLKLGKPEEEFLNQRDNEFFEYKDNLTELVREFVRRNRGYFH